MVNEFAHVTIVQESKNGYKIKVSGNGEYILRGLAAAVATAIKGMPEKYQQEARITFLHHLNDATNHTMEV